MMLRSLMSLIPAWVNNRIIPIICLSPSLMKWLFLETDPDSFERMSAYKTLAAFHRAYTKSPYYLNFITRTGLHDMRITTLAAFSSDVPEMSKESYIKKAENVKDLCFPDTLSDISIIYESSGYTGSPTSWPMTRSEENTEKRLAAFGLDLLYKTKTRKTLIINSFALGSWIAGVGLIRITSIDCAVINTGPDIRKGLDAVKRFSQLFDQIIIAGYPPFLKELIEHGTDIPWKELPIHLMLGGEGMPEEYRDFMWKMIGTDSLIYSIYGSSDVGIAGIIETEDSVKIKRRASGNTLFQKRLFVSTGTIPMLFQYDPTTFFIETNENNELLLTKLSTESAIPLIRYNSKDHGGVIPYRAMDLILSEHMPDIQIRLPLPFVYVTGRGDGSLNFFGSVIYPQTIQAALYEDTGLAKQVTGYFRLSLPYDKQCNPVIQVEIQLAPGIPDDESCQKTFSTIIEKRLFESSDDLQAKKEFFREVYPEGIVRVQIQEFDAYSRQNRLKAQYI